MIYYGAVSGPRESRLVVLGRSARARATEPAPATLHAHSMGLKVLKLPKTAFLGGLNWRP